MKTAMMLAAAIAATSVLGEETIKLPAPETDSGVTVMQALKARRSERAFSEKGLSLEVL